MLKLIRAFNAYFIAEPGEHIDLSDIFWWYGVCGVGTVSLIISIYFNVTF